MEQLITIFLDPVSWAALAMLIVMEIVLGIDNLVFIAIVTNRLPEAQQLKARRIGIALALILRLALLSMIAMLVHLQKPIVNWDGFAPSWRDVILVGGGLFLVWKATREIHHLVDPNPAPTIYGAAAVTRGFAATIVQILLLDMVFSIDSILTAVGMTQHVPIMMIAVIFAVIVMLIAADPLAEFFKRNPTIVMLALGFLLLIGTTLIADGFGFHIPRAYIYAAMGFSALVEGLNILARSAKNKQSD